MKRLLFLLVVAAVVSAGLYGLSIYDIQFPLGRMWETPAIRPHETPIPPMASGIIPIHGGEAQYRNLSGDEIISPLAPGDPAVISQGRTLYGIYCTQCHGKNHDGMGTVGQSFAPLPGDLRSPKVQGMTAGKLFHEISYGLPEGRQPALATTIAVADRWRIVEYVKSLQERN
ncbi:MAG: c-type cytochrome [Deltaproteobacteria bacterium]|nr:c-type cytochrome [Deltaproteobacteria bacterium]